MKQNIFFSLVQQSTITKSSCSLADVIRGLTGEKMKNHENYLSKLSQRKRLTVSLERRLPGIMTSGIFKSDASSNIFKLNSADDLIQYSQIICLEFNEPHGLRFMRLGKLLKDCPNTLLCFRSLRSNVWSILVRVNSGPEHHSIAYNQVKAFYEQLVGVNANLGDGLNRIMYMAYDEKLHFNSDASVFEVAGVEVSSGSNLCKPQRVNIPAPQLKNDILSGTNSGFEFFKFVIPNLEKVEVDRCKNVKNPFYHDSNASFSVFRDIKSNRWKFHDYGEPSFSGDVFDFAALYYDLDIKSQFVEILSNISKDLRMTIENRDTEAQLIGERKVSGPTVDSLPDYEEDVVEYMNSWQFYEHMELGFNGDPDDYNAWLFRFELIFSDNDRGIKKAFEYFQQYGITKEILKQYNVGAVNAYKKRRDDGIVDFKSLAHNKLAIAYFNYDYSKIYIPSPKNFWYLGKKPQSYIFGYDQLLRRLRKKKLKDSLIITGGEKNVLTLTALGFDAICFNSETASVPELLIDGILEHYKGVIIFFDLDETGIQRANELKVKLSPYSQTSIYNLPVHLKETGVKDISVYVALGFDPEKIKQEILAIADQDLAIENFGTTDANVDEASPANLTNPTNSTNTTFLPHHIYEHLPPFFRDLCSPFDNNIEKDLILLASLGVSSSLLPAFKGIYNRQKVGTNLFLFVSAPPASGKGEMKWARKLGEKVHHYLIEKYNQELMAYESDLQVYNNNKDENQDLVKPTEPKKQSFFLPANSSNSMIIQMLSNNQSFGLIFETEGDTLSDTISKEWGDFSVLIRKAFHHEPVSMARRGNNNEHIEVHGPHLSVVLSGTPMQINNLMEGVENGFFSRFLFYEFESEVEWNDQFGMDYLNTQGIYEAASAKIFDLWLLQENSLECIVRFKQEHIEKINAYFARRLKEMHLLHGDHIAASVKRMCLMCYRIGIILASLRWSEKKLPIPDILTISDDDFIVSFDIVKGLLLHLEKVYERLSTSLQTSSLNMQQQKLFQLLPADFSKTQLITLSAELGIKLKAAERYIEIYIERGILERYEHGKYRKVKR